MKHAAPLAAAALSLAVAAASLGALPARARAAAAANTLTPEEKAAGWRLLFDGKTSKGWRGFKLDTFPPDGRWVVEDGALHRAPGKRAKDLVTIDKFDSLDLKWDWKIARKGNSGLKYLVEESMSTKADDGVGFEYQMLDDERHPDAKKGIDGNRTAGSLYDLIPPGKNKVLHPPGEWNESRLVIDGSKVEHWLNGIKLLSFDRASPQFKKLIAQSKFKDTPGFGDVARGHILLQDHGDEVWVRSVKVRTPAKPPTTATK